MTKEELAKKKGIKLNKELSPSDSLVVKEPEKKSTASAKSTAKKTSTKTTPKKKPASEQKSAPKEPPMKAEEPVEAPVAVTPKPEEVIPVTAAPEKRGPGKPKKRKSGDKKISFWLDEDLVKGLYSQLSYGESAGEKINDAIRLFQKENNIYQP